MRNVRKHRNIRLMTNDRKRSHLVSEPNYHSAKYFSKNLLIIEMHEIAGEINYPVYLGLSILGVSKIAMYGYWCDYTKLKHGHKAKLC